MPKTALVSGGGRCGREPLLTSTDCGCSSSCNGGRAVKPHFADAHTSTHTISGHENTDKALGRNRVVTSVLADGECVCSVLVCVPCLWEGRQQTCLSPDFFLSGSAFGCRTASLPHLIDRPANTELISGAGLPSFVDRCPPGTRTFSHPFAEGPEAASDATASRCRVLSNVARLHVVECTHQPVTAC